MVSTNGSFRSGSLVIVAALWAGATAQAQSTEERSIIACSTTQVADFARQVVGDRWDVQCVLAPGQDPHQFRPKTSHVALVSSARLCLDNGLHLEGNDWMRVMADNAGKPIVSCSKGVKPRQISDGNSSEPVPDPHSWFTPLNAAVYCRNILQAVSQMDPTHQSEYAARTELYLAQLRSLHSWVTKQCSAVPPARRVLVTSHDAFGYFCDEYGFRSAAPVGWSTGQEIGGGVTPQRRRLAVASIREHGVKAIFVETSVNPKLIREIADEAGVTIGGRLYSDSMGTAGSAGETYIGMMRENVLTIIEALK